MNFMLRVVFQIAICFSFSGSSYADVPAGEVQVIFDGYQHALSILGKISTTHKLASVSSEIAEELKTSPIVEALDSWCYGKYAFTLRMGAPRGYIHRRKIYMCPTGETTFSMAQAMIHEALHIVLKSSDECRVDGMVKEFYQAADIPLAIPLERNCGL